MLANSVNTSLSEFCKRCKMDWSVVQDRNSQTNPRRLHPDRLETDPTVAVILFPVQQNGNIVRHMDFAYHWWRSVVCSPHLAGVFAHAAPGRSASLCSSRTLCITHGLISWRSNVLFSRGNKNGEKQFPPASRRGARIAGRGPWRKGARRHFVKYSVRWDFAQTYERT